MNNKPAKNEYLTNVQLITCVVQRGKAEDVAKAALKAGAPAATIYFARGTGVRERLGLLRIAISPEKEVIDIVAPNDKADEIFEAIVAEGKLETPGMGFIYMVPVSKAFPVIPR